MKKIYILIYILIIPFIFFLYVLYSPKNYTVEYKIEEYKIKETYVKDIEIYKFYINYKNKTYPLLIDIKYNKNRKLISKIDLNKKSDCLYIEIKDVKYSVCYKNNQLIDYRLLSLESIESEKVISDFNKNKIYNYNNLKYYIWNYKGYDYLSKDKNRSINVIDKDEYENLLSYQFKNYLITPNYDGDYYFTELLVIDNHNLELSSIKLDNEVSYSSRFLGDFKNDIYLLDEKNKMQYKINIKKEEVKVIGTEYKDGVLYINKKPELISLKKIIKNNYKFIKNEKYIYKIINNKLYNMIDDFKILISNKSVKEIVKIDNDQLYYLSKDTLYLYTPEKGEIKLLENIEWNFNYKNKIFIFN